MILGGKTTSELTCIQDLLHGGQDGRSHAIEAPGRAPITYDQLRMHVSGIVGALSGMGYRRNDRIAVVLPNGPDMAIAFLSVASGFTCAPLNPLYSRQEFKFYLSDLGTKALITNGEPSAAEEAACGMKIPIISLKSLYEARPPGVSPEFSRPEDTALVLHTSGTTSKPKRVPLTQANICASARNIAESLRLGPEDRCLNVMPLFHIHGLIGALLSSAASGATTICAPGFIASEFMGWLRDLGPTWYTAVPTIHQKVLEMAKSDPGIYGSLRFIRSASSALPIPILRGLEERFSVPVIEAYGMTEASHQITVNPLPPGTRVHGSVGIPWGTQVAILGSSGSILPVGEAGEVAIRGPNVTAGYEHAPEINAIAFFDRWLRTGDSGYLDEGGYLHLLGRLKEIINRGGEKVSPFEVEEALLAHPAVNEAAVFPVLDDALGEEVGAAVVLRQDATVSELKEFLAVRLAYFKVPTRLLILDAIPKGPTGKVSRVNMAEQLGITGLKREKPLEKFAPAPGIEAEIAAIWAEVLKHDYIHASDNFLDLGGDSLMATRAISRVRATLGVEVSIISLLDADDLASFARIVERRLNGQGIKGEKAREKV